MKYKQLTLVEREILYALKMQGKSFREIATVLLRSHTTLAREWCRGTRYLKPYVPSESHKRADRIKVKQRTKAPLKNTQIMMYVRENLRRYRSPEAIAGSIGKDITNAHITHEAIYQYIYGKGKEFKLCECLPKSRKKRKRLKNGRSVHRSIKSQRIPDARSIDERAQRVSTRKQIGHFETDLMEGTKKDRHVLTVEVERKTRYVILTKLDNKKAASKSKVLQKKLKMIQSLSKSQRPLVRTITADNGSENASHKEIELNLEVKMYFAHAYHSWEKGTVENTIGRIRRYIPKGTDLSKYTDEQIQWSENEMNDTPRKCLNYMTPNEMMEREANKYKFRAYKFNLYQSGALRS